MLYKNRVLPFGGTRFLYLIDAECFVRQAVLVAAGDEEEVAEGVGLQAEDVRVVAGGDAEFLAERLGVHRDVACGDLGAWICGACCLDRAFVKRQNA